MTTKASIRHSFLHRAHSYSIKISTPLKLLKKSLSREYMKDIVAHLANSSRISYFLSETVIARMFKRQSESINFWSLSTCLSDLVLWGFIVVITNDDLQRLEVISILFLDMKASFTKVLNSDFNSLHIFV